ncbi:MAG: response regulator [Anaerolineae bacterium]
MAERTSVLVVAAQSSLRESLTALLRSIPLITTVHQADGAVSGLRIAETTLPALVLLDASLPDGEAWLLLSQLRARWPQTQYVVLTDTTQLRRRAEAAGASRVVLKGFPAAKLSTLLEQLMQQMAQV